MSQLPRSEYPRPQFERADWLNLNGPWTFEIDYGKSGMERGMEKSTGFAGTILIPFCPESKLSGVEHKDFFDQIFYHRKITIPAEWNGKSVFLNFGGVDYECEAFINGQSVGQHFGGQCSFTFDITKFTEAGKEYDLVVRAKDELRSDLQPVGKQCSKYKSAVCSYTRTTGIWQTVWLEAAVENGLASCRITPALDSRNFVFRPSFLKEGRGYKLRVTISGNGVQTVTKTVPAVSGIDFTVDLTGGIRTWSPEDPFLYDILYEVLDPRDTVIDTVRSYSGLRKIHIEGDRLYLNNKPVFLRFVLDQGFYPTGIWTAPSDADLKKDIELSMAAGFNGARLHQKVFEERFHYWADKLGYLTWGESASWGVAFNSARQDSIKTWQSLEYFKAEWREIIERDYNHPSIIAWTPTNETHPVDGDVHCRIFENLYNFTRTLDPTRPVNECSGYVHAKTDLWTVHLYCPTLEKLKEVLFPKDSPVCFQNGGSGYNGQPYINDEWGGFKYIPADRKAFADNSWGYHGLEIRSGDELCELIRVQAEYMNQEERLQGWCYTQLTDIEQEQNGVYNYDRTPKVDPAKLKAAFTCGLKR